MQHPCSWWRDRLTRCVGCEPLAGVGLLAVCGSGSGLEGCGETTRMVLGLTSCCGVEGFYDVPGTSCSQDIGGNRNSLIPGGFCTNWNLLVSRGTLRGNRN